MFVSGLVVKGERVLASSFSDITSDSIEAKKDEIADATKQQADIKNSISNMQSIISGLQSQKKDLNKYIASLDNTMTDLEGKIHSFENLILQTQADIEIKQYELQIAEAMEAEQYDSMQKRIQFMYERGESGYIEALFQANSFWVI